MGAPYPSLALQQHLATMPSPNAFTISTALVSARTGVEYMDGQGILAGQTKSYARPWTGCIPFDQLTKDNLPPFYVRLEDNQVGHLAYWVSICRGSITRLKLGQVWPWDFDLHGKVSLKRDSWGAEYNGCGEEKGKGLGGGTKVPAWTDPGLPLTYTSSYKVMVAELDAFRRSAALKRKAEEEAGRNVCMPVKKPRLGSMAMVLKQMKETAEKKRRTADTEKERYTGGKSELRDAMHVVDTLMRSATETENQNAALETMLLKNEAQYIKNTDDMFDEWLAYNAIKRTEVDRMLEDHAAEIKMRDTEIGVLNVKGKKAQARLEREKQKVNSRDTRLAQVKRRWVQEQDRMKQRSREIEESALDLDELSELNNSEDDESDDDGEFSDFGDIIGKGGVMAMGEQQAEQKQQPQEPKNEPKKREAILAQEATQPETKRPLNRELSKSIVRETIKSRDLVHLDEEEGESDEGPISSLQKRKSRKSVRGRLV